MFVLNQEAKRELVEKAKRGEKNEFGVLSMDRKGMDLLLSDGGVDQKSDKKSRVRLFNLRNVLNST